MKKIPSENYIVFVGNDFPLALNQFLSQNYSDSKKFILADINTVKKCLPLLKSITSLKNAAIIEIESGEEKKNIYSAIKIWEKLYHWNADRKSLVINLGGGVIGDLGGFAASTFKRGIHFINIPTTLLSQVDASIGGKTGVDFSPEKNIVLKNFIGLFNNPKAVFVFPEFLKTLNNREILSGFAEIVKHALIKDISYFSKIKTLTLNSEKHNLIEMEEIIFRSIEIKNEIVLNDPHEKGSRKLLNFGHTIGHAVESFSLKNDKNPLLHGEAIAIGMICESYISTKVSGLTKHEWMEISQFIKSKYPFYKIADYKSVLQLMLADKKNENGKINFSLLSNIGNGIINQYCTDKLIAESLAFYNTQYIT